jgi:hypothetical protein
MSNNLTPQQIERFSYLAEELAETIQVVGKILRHGLHSYNPVITHTDYKISNKTLLMRELDNVKTAINLLVKNGALEILSYNYAPSAYMHYEENK